jgi:hypothetical protein
VRHYAPEFERRWNLLVLARRSMACDELSWPDSRRGSDVTFRNFEQICRRLRLNL